MTDIQTIIVGAIGVVTGVVIPALKYIGLNERYLAVVQASQKYAEGGMKYLRYKADGTFTVDEQNDFAKTMIEHFEEVEKITGAAIVNSPAVDWIKPVTVTAGVTANTASPTTATPLTATLQEATIQGEDYVDMGITVLPVKQSGESPFHVEFEIIASPQYGPHEVTDFVMDFGDGSQTSGKLINGRAKVEHTYVFARDEKHTGTTFLPYVTVTTKSGYVESTPTGAFYVMVTAPQ